MVSGNYTRQRMPPPPPLAQEEPTPRPKPVVPTTPSCKGSPPESQDSQRARSGAFRTPSPKQQEMTHTKKAQPSQQQLPVKEGFRPVASQEQEQPPIGARTRGTVPSQTQKTPALSKHGPPRSKGQPPSALPPSTSKSVHRRQSNLQPRKQGALLGSKDPHRRQSTTPARPSF